MVIGIVAPTDSGLPYVRSSIALGMSAQVPVTGIPVVVLHGPIPMRAALAVVSGELVVRPLAPLVPAMRLRRHEVTDIEVQFGHWYAFGRAVVCVRRVKGPTLRLMAPPVPGVPDGGSSLGALLRAWWRSGQG